MKKVISSGRRLLSKRKAPTTVNEYLALVPEPARSTLSQMRESTRSVVPATEAISYQIPAFTHKRVLVWFAAFSDHCSLFPTASVLEALKGDLKGFKTGTVQFPIDKPLPISLIKKIVKERVAQIEGKERR